MMVGRMRSGMTSKSKRDNSQAEGLVSGHSAFAREWDDEEANL